MGVDLGGLDTGVAEQFLDGANIGATFEQMGGKAMAKSMARGMFGNAGLLDGSFDGALQAIFGEMMATH